MSSSSKFSSQSMSSSKASKTNVRIDLADCRSSMSFKTSRLKSEGLTTKSFRIAPKQASPSKSKERRSTASNMKHKSYSSGMDILTRKEMLKFEHASNQKFDASLKSTRLEVQSRMGRMNQVMHKMRNARLQLQAGNAIVTDSAQSSALETKPYKKEAAALTTNIKGFNQLVTKKKTVFFASEDEKEISGFLLKAHGADNELKLSQAHMVPIPQLRNNEKFAFFYRPYNYTIHTRKYMNFENLKTPEEDDEEPKPEPEVPMTFDYVLLKEKLKREKQQAQKILEAQKQQKKMHEKEKKKSQSVGVKKEKKVIEKKDEETTIDEAQWRKDREIQFQSNHFESGWSCIMQFILQSDPRIRRYVVQQLKLRARAYRTRPKKRKKLIKKETVERKPTKVMQPFLGKQLSIKSRGSSSRNLFQSKKLEGESSSKSKTPDLPDITVRQQTKVRSRGQSDTKLNVDIEEELSGRNISGSLDAQDYLNNYSPQGSEDKQVNHEVIEEVPEETEKTGSEKSSKRPKHPHKKPTVLLRTSQDKIVMRAVESQTDSSLSCNLSDEDKKKKSPRSSSNEEDANQSGKQTKRTSIRRKRTQKSEATQMRQFTKQLTSNLRRKKTLVSSAFTKSIINPIIKKKENLFLRAMSIRAQSFKIRASVDKKSEETPSITASSPARSPGQKNLQNPNLPGGAQDPLDAKGLSMLIGTRGLSIKRAGTLMNFEQQPSRQTTKTLKGNIKVNRLETTEMDEQAVSNSFETDGLTDMSMSDRSASDKKSRTDQMSLNADQSATSPSMARKSANFRHTQLSISDQNKIINTQKTLTKSESQQITQKSNTKFSEGVCEDHLITFDREVSEKIKSVAPQVTQQNQEFLDKQDTAEEIPKTKEVNATRQSKSKAKDEGSILKIAHKNNPVLVRLKPYSLQFSDQVDHQGDPKQQFSVAAKSCRPSELNVSVFKNVLSETASPMVSPIASKVKMTSLQQSGSKLDAFENEKLFSPGSNPEILQSRNKIETLSVSIKKSEKEKYKNGLTLYRNRGRTRSGIITARGRNAILAQKRDLQKNHMLSQRSNTPLKTETLQINDPSQAHLQQEICMPEKTYLSSKRQSEQLAGPVANRGNFWMTSNDSFLEAEISQARRARLHSGRPQKKTSRNHLSSLTQGGFLAIEQNASTTLYSNHTQSKYSVHIQPDRSQTMYHSELPMSLEIPTTPNNMVSIKQHLQQRSNLLSPQAAHALQTPQGRAKLGPNLSGRTAFKTISPLSSKRSHVQSKTPSTMFSLAHRAKQRSRYSTIV